jgi:hypothetical protein
MHFATAPTPSNTERLSNAAHRLMQAERTGDADAAKKAAAYVRFYEAQVTAEGARERMNLYPAQ